MKSIIIFTCILLNAFLASCSFQISLFKEINKVNIKNNAIISPLCAYLVLGFAANGAEGEALDEMMSVLENVNIEEVNEINGKITIYLKEFSSINLANAVMNAKETKSTFQFTSIVYEIPIEKLESITQVNNWCKESTKGNIEAILYSYDPKVVMLLLNAIYFNGKWKTEFDRTKKGIFYDFNDKLIEKQVELMTIESEFSYYEDKTVQIIELPYDKDDLSAIIILPNEDMNINDYIINLTDDKLSKLIKRMHSQKIYLELPKFEIGFSVYLTEALKEMGMKIPFTSKANFSKIGKDVYLSEIIQKIIFSVNEKGANSAKVKNEINITKNEEKRLSMIVNRPFLFMLRNSKFPTNYQILFMAKLEYIKLN